MAVSVSKTLVSEDVAPKGKPITVQTLTGDPLSNSAHKLTQVGLIQTEANPYLRASKQSCAISCCVASGLSNVWSIIFAMLRSWGITPSVDDNRSAPALTT